MSDPEMQAEEAIKDPAPEQEAAAETTEPPTEEATPEPAPEQEPAPEPEPAAETTEPSIEEARPEPASEQEAAPEPEPVAATTESPAEEATPDPAPEMTASEVREKAPEAPPVEKSAPPVEKAAPPVEKAAGDEEAPPPAPEAHETSKVAPSPPEAGEPGDDPKAPQDPAKLGADGKPIPKKKKKELEKNAKFLELEETGAWGSVGKTEKYVAIGVFSLIIIVVIVVVSVLVATSDAEEIVELPPTKAPTAAPTDIQIFTELEIVLDAIEVSDYTYTLLEDLPFVRSFYEGLKDDPSATPQQRAMSWLLYEDDRDRTLEVALRWVLASLYYNLGGENWISAVGWLSGDHICDWEHVLCDVSNGIQELDLSNNNLVGSIPNELIMLGNVQAIWLSENQLTGTIPGDMLGSLPKISILYLNDNQLTGTVPASLDKDGNLNSLFIQYNMLTGEWPREFCPAVVVGAVAPVGQFGLDCDELECLPGCCSAYNCYYEF